MSTLDYVTQLLQVPPDKRSPEQLRRLKSLTSDIKFFQKLTEDHGNDICHTRLCSRLTLRRYQAEEYIFNFNDAGDFFCIILKGKVSVLIPDKTNLDSLRRNSLINLRPEKRLSRAAEISQASKPDLAEDANVHQPTLVLNEVAILEAGSVFGELSIISGQPRVASVQCKELTYCAVLSRQDFQLLLGSYEQQKLKEKVDILGSLPLFRGWTLSYLKKQHFYFKEATYHRSQTVYSQGKPAVNLYIIKEGEFKVRTRQTYKRQSVDNSKSSNLITRAHHSYRRLEVRHR
jgi:CRP-like cAMP-binding protein